MTATLFQVAYLVSFPFWIIMIFVPGWTWTGKIAASPLIMLPTLAVYLVFAIPLFPDLWVAVSKPTLHGFQEFLTDGRAVTLLWAQVIAWDLFIGRWLYLDSRARGIHPLIMGPLLVLATLIAPFVVLVYLAIRPLVTRREHAAGEITQAHLS